MALQVSSKRSVDHTCGPAANPLCQGLDESHSAEHFLLGCLQNSQLWATCLGGRQAQGDQPNPRGGELAAPDKWTQLQAATELSAAAAAADPSHWSLLTAQTLTHSVTAVAAV